MPDVERIAELQAQVEELKAENCKLKHLSSTNSGLLENVRIVSDRNAKKLSLVMGSLLPYAKGSEMRLGLVSKDLLQAVRNNDVGGKGEIPIQGYTSYFENRQLTEFALDD